VGWTLWVAGILTAALGALVLWAWPLGREEGGVWRTVLGQAGLLLGVALPVLYFLGLRPLRRQLQARQDLTVAELKVALSRFETLIQNSPIVAIQGFDAQGTILHWNEASAQLYGYSAAEALGRRIQDVVCHPEDVAAFEQDLDLVCRSRQRTSSKEYRVRARDGSDRWVYSAMFPVCSRGRVLEVFCMDVDITQRRNTEEALQDSEERYRRLVELSPEGIFIHADGRFIYANPAGINLLGARRLDEVVGRAVLDFFVAGGKEIVKGKLELALEEGKVVRLVEERLRRMDGQTLLVEAIAIPFMLHGIPAMQVVARDVTKRRRAEEVLRLQSAALESADNGILLTDNEGRIVWANPAFTRLTGYTLEEVLGQNPRVLKSGRHSPAEYAALWQTILGGRVWHGELVNRRKDGALYDEELTITPVRDADGSVTHFVAIKQDISERKRMETDLRQSREQFQRIFSVTPAAIGIAARSTGKFLELNETFSNMTGYPREECLGRSGLELGLWIDLEDRTRFYGALQQEGSLRNFETRFRDRAGRAHEVLLSVEMLQMGQEECLLFIVSDITQHKQLEGELRQAQKMEAIGQLAGGVAHDFNNILTVIQGHTNLVSADPGLSPDSVESLKEVSDAAERAANLTRQLLTFSRKQPLQARTLDLNELVHNLTKMLRRLIGEDITLEVQYAPHLPPVFVDLGMMEQIILNLSINARDAMPKGGRLIISTDAQQVKPPQLEPQAGLLPAQFACLSVRDTGNGIPPEVLPRIFEPFFTTKEVGKGTGLGLATVHGIIQQHRGWIEVESQVGVGSVFRIYLPTAGAADDRHASTGGRPRIRGGHETILLVEDEDPLRTLARQVLQGYGYTVWEAADGAAALRLWQQHSEQIALLLSDVVMPGGLNGSSLADILEAQKPDLKVILTTGYSAAVAGEEFQPSDRRRLLLKPYPPHVLAKAVRDCLDGVAN